MKDLNNKKQVQFDNKGKYKISIMKTERGIEKNIGHFVVYWSNCPYRLESDVLGYELY